MSSEDQPQQPANPSSDPTPPLSDQPAKPGSEPTIPIRLQAGNDGRFNLKKTLLPRSKPAEPEPAAPSSAGAAPADAGAAVPTAGDDQWLGREQTLVGAVPAADPQAPTPPAGEGPWLGREATMVPVSKPAEAQPAEPWLGREGTMVGMPAPVPSASPDGGEGPWLGRESTLLGMPAPATGGAAAAPTPTPAPRNKTTATMDDGWHLKGRQGPLTGKSMGDYEIGGVLGEGGMGTVYRARQISLKRRVALKVLPPTLAHDQRLRDRFESEARTASLISSPHVVQVFAAGNHEDTVFFVMEFVEGTDLSDIISARQQAQQPFTPDEAGNYIVQAARGLAEAGKHGIVHRDIKPPNLMVTTKGVVKIADFGISKVAGEHSLTMTGTAVGTPAYVSPEQGRGDPVDPRSDLYSLGVVFYELLTMQKPFDGATPNALIYQHNYTEPKLPKEIRPDLPDEYQAVVLKCLQKDPAKRYQDANELVGDLERIRAGSAPMTALMSAFGTGAEEAMRRLGIKQRRTWPWVVAATAVLSIGGGSYWWWQVTTSERNQQRDAIARLRQNLSAILDAPLEHPANVVDDLAKLRREVGDKDADVVRFTDEVTKVAELETLLATLDQVELPDAPLRVDAARAIVAYEGFVGRDGERWKRWTTKLAEADAEAAKLRTALRAALDGREVLRVADADAAQPQLDQLRFLAGAEDAEVARWSQRLDKAGARVRELRTTLARLDVADTRLGKAALDDLELALGELGELIGKGHPDVAKWTAAIAGRRDIVAKLRASLARLPKTGVAPAPLIKATAKDLELFAALADANDTDLKVWQNLVQSSRERIEALRGQLGRLGKPEPLLAAERTTLKQSLADFEPLADPSDEALPGWRQRMADEERMVAARERELERLAQPEPLTAAEIAALRRAVDLLERLGDLPAARASAHRLRLDAGEAAIAQLRAQIAPRMTADPVRLDKALGDQIEQLSTLVGESDDDVKRWKRLAGEFFALRKALAPLNAAEPLPEKVDELLARYAAVVGEDGDLKAWKTKVAEVKDLKARLVGVDAKAPLPDGARVDIDALVERVGLQDLEAKRWKLKIDRVGELGTSLNAALASDTAVVLAIDALARVGREVRELESLVSREDQVADDFALRVALLEGPARPAWASDFGRDQWGLYATVLVANQRLRFRYVPGGSVAIGSPDRESGRDRDETAVRMKVATPYWIAETETTQGFWEAVGVPNPSRFDSSEKPVERVSWDDCHHFLLALSRKVADLNPRLPTELEWEFACRAGHGGRWIGSAGEVVESRLDAVAWYGRNSGGGTRAVAGKEPNPLGLFDLHGNVWEWCQDTYGLYSTAITTDWVGRGGEQHVLRGGSWADKPAALRAANRLGADTDLRTLYAGFRIAAPVTWPDADGPTVLRTLRRGLVRVDAAPDAAEPESGDAPDGAPAAETGALGPAPVAADAPVAETAAPGPAPVVPAPSAPADAAVP